MTKRFRSGPKRERMLRVKVTEAQGEALEDFARRHGRTLSEVVRNGIDREIGSDEESSTVRGEACAS